MATAKKILLAIAVVIVLPIAWWLISPLFITNKVSEALPEGVFAPSASPLAVRSQVPSNIPQASPVPSPVVERRGTFTGFDALHRASGTARIIQAGGKAYVRFEDDFTVTNGPDLFVHLGKDGEYAAEANLGRLKGNEGSQNYEIPPNIDVSEYTEVWVWCRAFSVPFGKANLT